MNDSAYPCRFLEWDTSFFGKRIAQVQGSSLNQEFIRLVIDWCDEQSIDCLYFLSTADDLETVRIAEDHGFRLVEIRFTLERSLKDWDPETRPRSAENILIRPAVFEDIPDLQEIARQSYVDSRFYFDKNFSSKLWGDYYATWVKKSCEGGADLALTAVMDNRTVGYITGLVDQQTNQGIYELTGVSESERRSGVGQELFRSGLDWYVRHAIDYLRVATQGRNIKTQRMIQRHGFLSKSCQFYFHKWFSDQNAPNPD